jgi:hypothetical protein
MKSFDAYVLNSSYERTGVDYRTMEYVKEINRNPKIHVLFYRKSELTNPQDNSSYLHFTYAREVELRIYREVIGNLLLHYNDINNKIKFSYMFFRSKDSLDPKTGDLSQMHFDTEDYTCVNTIKIELECENNEVHDNFWNTVRTQLSPLGEH